MARRLLRLLVLVVACLAVSGVAQASVSFGALAVYEGGTKVSESSGGVVRSDVSSSGINGIETEIRFRDVTADG